MNTTTVVSAGTFSTASRYPAGSTATRLPYFRWLGLCRLVRSSELMLESSSNRFARHVRMKSSSSSSELMLFSRENRRAANRFRLKAGGDWPVEKACNVCRKLRFRAKSKERASAMTPLGPVLAVKWGLSGMW